MPNIALYAANCCECLVLWYRDERICAIGDFLDVVARGRRVSVFGCRPRLVHKLLLQR